MPPPPGDYVPNSFMGSGTTAAVAHKMGRRYIGVEMGEQAKTHCAARLKKVIDGEAARLPNVSLKHNNIEFKQTPYDIKVW